MPSGNNQSSDTRESHGALEALASPLGETWPAIFAARQDARAHIGRLRQLVAQHEPPSDTSVVAFGSLAREEWTSGSDVDWTLLIDGPSDMRHFYDGKAVEGLLQENGYGKPGPTGTFGAMSSSHELVHHIGGTEDTNHNITRRVLLLLESVPFSDDVAHQRVKLSILERYIVGDPPATTPAKFRVPMFLLNDVVRYWRTMAVDYATKKWQRSSEGWALRNIKLRMSRKLLFAKGLLMCLLCHQDFAGEPSSQDPEQVQLELLRRCLRLSEIPALELLADALRKYADSEIARTTINAYDRFLRALNDPEKREKLEALDFEKTDDELFREQRENTRHFRDGLEALFFDSEPQLAKLTRRYGVF